MNGMAIKQSRADWFDLKFSYGLRIPSTMTGLNIRHLEDMAREEPAFTWPSTEATTQIKVFKPLLGLVLQAVSNNEEFELTIEEGQETEACLTETGEGLELTRHSLIRSIGISIHMLCELDYQTGAYRYIGIMPDGSPVEFVWRRGEL